MFEKSDNEILLTFQKKIKCLTQKNTLKANCDPQNLKSKALFPYLRIFCEEGLAGFYRPVKVSSTSVSL